MTFDLSRVQTHPDFPKKPLTPYFRFFMEKRAKYAKIHPEMSNLDLTKILSKKYKELPDKKKVRSAAQPELAVRVRVPKNQTLVCLSSRSKSTSQSSSVRKKTSRRTWLDSSEFYFLSHVAVLVTVLAHTWLMSADRREEHPELIEERKKSDLPEKPKTPQQLWYNHEKKTYMKLHPEVRSAHTCMSLCRRCSSGPIGGLDCSAQTTVQQVKQANVFLKMSLGHM